MVANSALALLGLPCGALAAAAAGGASLTPGAALDLRSRAAAALGNATFLRVGRSLLSTNPVAAAHVFVERMGGRILDSAEEATAPMGFLTSPDSSCAQIVTVELSELFASQRIQFVNDFTKRDPRNHVAAAHDAQLDFDAYIDAQVDSPPFEEYSAWVENHDGYSPYKNLNLTGMGTEGESGVSCRDGTLRGWIPGTFSTWESPFASSMYLPDETKADFEEWGCSKKEWDLESELQTLSCRIDLGYESNGMIGEGWHKTTSLTFDPLGAEVLATDLLGFHRIRAQYPENHTTFEALNCTHYAKWVYSNLTLPDGNYQSWMMHFVESDSTVNRTGGIQAREFMEDVVAARDLSGRGTFDTYMYSSVIFQVPSLQGYKSRAESLGVPYYERLVGGDCAMWVTIPGSMYTFEIVAAEGCDKESTPAFDVCDASS